MILPVDLQKKLVSKVHYLSHLAYCGLVYVESHGLYGVAAGIMGMAIVAESLIERREAA